MMDAIGHTIGYVLTVVAVAIVMLVVDCDSWRCSYCCRCRSSASLPGCTRGATTSARDGCRSAAADAATLVEETVSGIRVVKGLGAGGALSGRFRTRSDRDRCARARRRARSMPSSCPALEVLPLIGIAAVLWVGGRRVISGGLSHRLVRRVQCLRRHARLAAARARPAGVDRSRRRSPRARGSPRCSRPSPGCVSRGIRGARPSCPRRGAAGGRAASATRATARCSTASISTLRAGRVARARRRDRLRQEHGRRTARALLRPGRRPRAPRRPSTCASSGSPTCGRRSRSSSRRRSCSRTRVRENIALRRARRATTNRSQRAAALAGAAEFIAATAGRVRHGARRARLLAVGRPAPADRDRAGDPRRSGGARSRRRDLGGRRDEGARDPRARSRR